jgi:hypothetical protein
MTINRSFRKSKRYQKKSKSIKKYNRFASMRGGSSTNPSHKHPSSTPSDGTPAKPRAVVDAKLEHLKANPVVIEILRKIDELNGPIKKIMSEPSDKGGLSGSHSVSQTHSGANRIAPYSEQIRSLHAKLANVIASIIIQPNDDKLETETELRIKIEAAFYIKYRYVFRTGVPSHFEPYCTILRAVFDVVLVTLLNKLITMTCEKDAHTTYNSIEYWVRVHVDKNIGSVIYPDISYSEHVWSYMEQYEETINRGIELMRGLGGEVDHVLQGYRTVTWDKWKDEKEMMEQQATAKRTRYQ